MAALQHDWGRHKGNAHPVESNSTQSILIPSCLVTCPWSAGVKNVPILYVVRDEKCQAVVAELADSEMQTFSTLVYD